jgi:hypothetical protein
LPCNVIFILFTVHYYFDTWIQMLIKSCVNYYFSLSFLRKKNTKEIRKHVSSLSTIQSNNKLKFLLIWKNAVETAKIAVDSCYILRQFLTPLPSNDFREIQGLLCNLHSEFRLLTSEIDSCNTMRQVAWLIYLPNQQTAFHKTSASYKINVLSDNSSLMYVTKNFAC